MTKVVHCKHQPFDVYIGRPMPDFPEGSPFCNPFKIGIDGNRTEVLAKYESYLRGRQDLLDLLPSLEGKTLGCWCFPKKCHGDIIIKILNELNLDKRFFSIKEH